MRLLYEIVEILTSFIELYFLYWIFQIIFQKYRRVESRIPDIVFSMLGVCMVRICNHINAFSYILSLIVVLYITISAVYLYKIKYMMLLSVASFYILCIYCWDFLWLSTLSALGGGMDILNQLVSVPGLPRMGMIVVIKGSSSLILLLLKKTLKRFAENEIKGKQIFIISICGLLGAYYLTFQTLHAFHYKLTGVWLLLMAICILLMFVFYFVVSTKQEKMKADIAQMRNQMLENNYHSVSNLYESNAKLYHDLNNHLNVLYQLLEDGNSNKAKDYISEISKPISALQKITWTGVDVVDVVINSKLQIMKEKGILADVNVEFPENTGILPNDMCTILSNLLDNAIEAAEKVEGEKTISLTIRRINHFIMIKVTNPYLGERNWKGDVLATTKGNKRIHGWGLQSVKSTVEKYNGTFKYETEQNMFIAKIMLCFQANN